MQLNTVSRDRSMADNVEWIANHNPTAKIVIWAHDGHVSKASGGVEPMGAALHTRYGDRLFVFGSAFGGGSFQAIPMGGGALKNFTVPPAPAGSLDATLSAPGIPAFAIDLRQAPDWFRQPHTSRQIGAMYPEGAPFAMLGKHHRSRRVRRHSVHSADDGRAKESGALTPPRFRSHDRRLVRAVLIEARNVAPAVQLQGRRDRAPGR